MAFGTGQALSGRLRSHLLPLARILGLIILLFGLCMLVPLAVSHVLEDGAEEAFDVAFLATTGVGGVCWLIGRRFHGELQTRDGFLLVSLVWTVLPAFGAVPLVNQIAGLSYTDAYFEAVSGLTATGATVLSGLDHLPGSINLWRALMHWVGGLGIIVLAVAVLPLLGIGGRQLYRAETPGPMKDTKLTPRIAETAKGFWTVYAGLTIVCALAYRIAGMGWLDAVIHALSTMALGGFSSHDASIGYFNSPLIEAVAIAFMFVAGISFATHFLALRRRSVAAYLQDPEARGFALLVVASILAVSVMLWQYGVYADFPTALRYAAFNVLSVGTTLGFATTDYAQWPIFAPMVMLFLCTMLTCSGSTGGGIKMVRAEIMTKQMFREATQLLHPRAQVPLRLGGAPISNRIVLAVLAYMSVYGATTLALVFLLTASGLDILTAISAAVACLNNTGPGLGQVGPASTYSVLSNFQTWVCTAAMLLGRLELFTLLIIFTPGFWRR